MEYFQNRCGSKATKIITLRKDERVFNKKKSEKPDNSSSLTVWKNGRFQWSVSHTRQKKQQLRNVTGSGMDVANIIILVT